MLKKEPRQARSKWMVETILQAATRVLERAPLAEVTTNHIAAVAGVSVGSLYQYFDSKEAIAICLLERNRRRLVEQVRSFGDHNRGAALEHRFFDLAVEILDERLAAPTYYLNLWDVRNAHPELAAHSEYQLCLAEAIASILCEQWPDAGRDASLLTARLMVSGVSILIEEAIRLPMREHDAAVRDQLAVLIPAYLRTLAHRPFDGRRSSAA